MARIGIAAGHTRRTDGERLYEHQRCHMAAEVVADLARMAGHEVVVVPEQVYDLTNDASLRRRVQLFNHAATDYNIELHLNAGGGSYSTTIFFPGSEEGEYLATDIEDAVHLVCPWKSIGQQDQTYFDRNLHFLMSTRAPSVIVEPGFKDNVMHREWMDSDRFAPEYAAAVFVGIASYGLTQG